MRKRGGRGPAFSLVVAAGVSLALILPAFAQPAKPAPAAPPAPEKPPPPVDQAKIDAAIDKAAAWLKAQVKKGLEAPPDLVNHPDHRGSTHNELVLYTLLHAGVDRNDPDIVKLVNDILKDPPVHTYTTALRALAFQLYDEEKLRNDIVHCAEFLVDNQCANGQWSYSRPVPLSPLPVPTIGAGAKKTLTGGGAAAPPREDAAPKATKARKKIVLTRKGAGPPPGDNSNTQYAILGLRACMNAGVWPPPETLALTEKWLTENQRDDGGWNYTVKEKERSYGSMAVGGVGSLAIILGAQGKDPRGDPRVQKGLGWMAGNLDFGRNPPDAPYAWQYYWIYGIERAGSLCRTEWLGDQAWYAKGAEYLVKTQHDNGTWLDPGSEQPGEPKEAGRLRDTCWAVLFLKRATRGLVYTKESAKQ